MLEREAEVAVRAAEEAGRILASHSGPALAATRKAGGEPVSIADLESDRALRKHLTTAFPADAILTEEGVDDSARLAAERVWIIDPLDGTRDFLDGSDEFAIHVGLALRGEPVIGVVHRPLRQETFLGIAGGGARFRRGQGAWGPIRVSAAGAGLRVVVTRSHPSAETRRLLDLLRPTTTLQCGSSGLKCAMVAAGSCEAYLAATDKMREWDVCAPLVIVEAAGGRCTDLLGGRLRFNQPDPAVPRGLLATNGRRHDELVARLSAGREEIGWLRERG